MRIRMKVFCIAVLFNTSLCFAQREDNYFYLSFPESKFSKYLRAGQYPNFDRFIFNYVPTVFDNKGGFILTGFAYNKDGTRITNSLTVLSPINRNPRKLKNKNSGEIHFTKDKLQEVKGCPFYLEPKKYKEGTGNEDNYVSYRVRKNGHCIKFIEFDLDPCPPEVCNFAIGDSKAKD